MISICSSANLFLFVFCVTDTQVWSLDCNAKSGLAHFLEAIKLYKDGGSDYSGFNMLGREHLVIHSTSESSGRASASM